MLILSERLGSRERPSAAAGGNVKLLGYSYAGRIPDMGYGRKCQSVAIAEDVVVPETGGVTVILRCSPKKNGFNRCPCLTYEKTELNAYEVIAMRQPYSKIKTGRYDL